MKKAATKKATKKTTKRGAAKQAAPRSTFRPKPKPKAKPKSRAVQIAERADRVVLGEITVPSGKLAIFDIGLVGYLPRAALDPAIVFADVPRDRPLPVVGTRVGKGRYADAWEHLAVVVGDGEPTHAKRLGEAGVDFARVVFMDHAALDHWQHDDSLDGKADFVFWGRDAGKLARAIRAPKLPEGHGWVNLSVAEAEARSDLAAKWKADNRWLLAMDLRPHSHHFQILERARVTGSGTLELAGTTLLLAFTSWGDGVFPVFVDLDHDDHPVRIRVQLAIPE